MSPRYNRAIEQAFSTFGDYTRPTPRLHNLYADARKAWLDSRSAAYDLHELLLKMAFEKSEIDVPDEDQLRLAYGIPRREA